MKREQKKAGPAKRSRRPARNDDLSAYSSAPYNPREITPEALSSLRESERVFGDLSGLVVNRRTNNVVCGHQRRTAANELALGQLPINWTDETTCNLGPEAERFESVERFGYVVLGSGQRFTVREVDWPEDFEKAANVSANNPAIQGTFTAELMPLLDDVLLSLGQSFFEGLALDEIALDFPTEPEEGKTDPDDVPEEQEVIVTKPGDLWLCGEHRVLCGDSTSAGDVARLMGGAWAEMMVTDPPYGVNYAADWRNHALRADGSPVGGKAIGEVVNDDVADWSGAWRLFQGDIAYVYHAGVHSPVVAASLDECGFERRALIIWAKHQMVIGRGDYHHQHEPCWYSVRKGRPGRRTGDRAQTTLWQIDKPHKSETGHSTQKPVECMARPIRNHDVGLIYDPFLGSGTTLIAAEQLGRKCYGLEIAPQYVDVIVRRWQEFTGKEATLEGDGRTFEKVSSARKRGKK